MNDELKNKSVEILTQIQQAVQSGAEVVGQQIPDIARQNLVYGMVWDLSVALLLSVVIVLFYLVIRLWESKNPDLDSFQLMVCLMLLFVPLFIYVRAALFVTPDPKVWLIKEIADLFN
jgi:hypothetical protein